MKKHSSYLKIISIIAISILGMRLVYRPHEPDYYSLFLKDVNATSMVNIKFGERIIYHGKLGKVGLYCLSSYEENGWIPHGVTASPSMKIEGGKQEHYITLNLIKDVLYSYQLWHKTSNSSYRSKAERVDLLTRCKVTTNGFVDNEP